MVASKCYGKDGQDLYIKVPMGTIIREAESNKIIADLSHKGQELVLLRGGKGGKGNVKFVLLLNKHLIMQNQECQEMN